MPEGGTMSAAAASPAPPEVVAPIKGGRKKLILLIAVVLVALLLGGAGGMLWLKSRAAHASDDGAAEDDSPRLEKAAKSDPAKPPTFLPLDVFVVNLADRDTDRYAQVGITLELDSALFADQMKAYMPAIRNAILMILAHKSAHELLEREGKLQLAEEIQRESVRPMGIEIPAPTPLASADAGKSDGADEVQAPARKPARRNVPHNPVRHVHFSNFIVQ
jgi:flagellar FliL protein